MFLSRLQLAGRHRRVIEVCRQIRRFATTCDSKNAGVFTYEWERHAYEDLRDSTPCGGCFTHENTPNSTSSSTFPNIAGSRPASIN
jgi:hypothetical protein